MENKEFAIRLSKLRINRDVSARDMCLSMGQNAGYINNIELSKTLPSLIGFFSICNYLEVTPSEFFDTASINPTKADELKSLTKVLTNDQLDHIIAIVNDLKRR